MVITQKTSGKDALKNGDDLEEKDDFQNMDDLKDRDNLKEERDNFENGKMGMT